MSSTIEKQFEEINSLLNYGQFKKALEVIEKNLKKKEITKKEKNLQFIVTNIQEEQAKLKQQQNMWNRMKEQKAPLKETLKEVHLDSSAKKLASETILEVRDERTGDVIEYRKLFALKI